MNIFSLILDARTDKPFAVVVQKSNGISAIGVSERGKRWAQTASRKYTNIADVFAALDVNLYNTDSAELSDAAVGLLEDKLPSDIRERLLAMFDKNQTFAQPVQKKERFGDVTTVPLVFGGASKVALINYKAAAFRCDIHASSLLLEEKAGRVTRARRRVQAFDPNAVDADNDGLVQDSTPFERPANPLRAVQSRVTQTPSSQTNQPQQPAQTAKPGVQRRVGRRIRKLGVSIEERGKERDNRRLQRRLDAQQPPTNAPNGPNLPNGAPSTARVPRGARRGRRGSQNVAPVNRTTTGNVPSPAVKPGKTPVSRTISPQKPSVPKRQQRGTAPKKKVRDRIRERLDTFADDITTPGAVTARRQQRRAAKATKRTQRGTTPAKSSGAAAKPKRRGILQTLEEFADNISTPGKVTAERRRRRDARRAAKGRASKRTASTQKARITQRPQPGKRVYGQKTNWNQLSDKQKKAVKTESIKRLAELEAKWQKRLGKGPDDDILESEIQDYIDDQIRKGASQARLGVLRADYNDIAVLAEMENADDFSQLDRVGPTRRKAILTDAKAIAKPRPPAKPKPKPAKPKPTPSPAPVTPAPAPSPKPKPKPKPKPAKPKPATPKPKPAKPKPKTPAPTPTPSTPASFPSGPKVGGPGGPNMPTYAEVTSWPQVPGPTGSNGGTWHRDPTSGRTYFVKPSTGTQGKERAMNEAAVAAFYRAAGVPIPNVSAADDGKGNYFIISEKVNITPWSASKQDEAKKHMGFDMLISNWDAFGAGGQNVGVDAAGNVVRIDAGGGGLFRATGAAKPDFDPNKPWKETSTMINSPFGKDMYGDVTNKEFADAMRAVAELDINDVEREMRLLGIDANTQKQILDVIRARQSMAGQFADDFDKYDPDAKVVITPGNPIAPGGKMLSGSKTARKKVGVKKVSQVKNPAERNRPARKRAVATIAKLLERNRNGSAFGDDMDKPKVTPATVKGLAAIKAKHNGAVPRNEADRMTALYELHGFSDKPIQATPAEIQELIDQGWTPMLRGVVERSTTNGLKPDPNNPNQTQNQRQVWGWLAGNRFISGTGSSGNLYGPGDYFSDPMNANSPNAWKNYHSNGQKYNGLENNATILALTPPSSRMITTQDLSRMKQEHQRHLQVIQSMIDPRFGSQKNATAKQVEKAIPSSGGRGPRDNPITNTYLQLLEEKDKAKTASAKKEAQDAIDVFLDFTNSHEGYTAMLLGYDGVEHGAGASGVKTYFNRSHTVVLGEATSLQKAKTLLSKTKRFQSRDPKVVM